MLTAKLKYHRNVGIHLFQLFHESGLKLFLGAEQKVRQFVEIFVTTPVPDDEDFDSISDSVSLTAKELYRSCASRKLGG